MPDDERGAEYAADVIKLIDSADAIRRRPGMYIGDPVDPLTFNRLLGEAMCLALDSACSGACSFVEVTLGADGSVTVEDDGPGLSLAPSVEGRPKAEILFTVLGACREAKANREVGHAACGVGMVVVNALSAWLEVRTADAAGSLWRQRYVRGRKQGPFEKLAAEQETGTVVKFLPDATIFGSLRFDAHALVSSLRNLQLDLGKTVVRVIDERDGARCEVR